MTIADPAARLIRLLNLKPHPEGGHYRETFRDAEGAQGRAASTAIYFLLKAGEQSRWHRIDAVEIWHWYDGAPLALHIAENGSARRCVLGNDFASGQDAQIAVAAGAWQCAHSLGDYSLVGCTVAPGFLFAHFELAPDGFAPGDSAVNAKTAANSPARARSPAKRRGRRNPGRD